MRSVREREKLVDSILTLLGSGITSKYRRRSVCLAAMLFRMTSTAAYQIRKKTVYEHGTTH